MTFERKTDKSEILDVFGKIVEEKMEENDQEKILVPVSSLATHFQMKINKQISDVTLRRYGVNPNGIFVKKWPNVFDYYTKGRSKRGILIEVEAFIEEFDERFDDDFLEDYWSGKK